MTTLTRSDRPASGDTEGRQKNPLRYFKVCKSLPASHLCRHAWFLIAICHFSFGLASTALAQTCRDGCYYPNTYQGVDAFPYETLGSGNTALGYIALNPTGSAGGFTQNTAIGAMAVAHGNEYILGSSNTAVGFTSMQNIDA